MFIHVLWNVFSEIKTSYLIARITYLYWSLIVIAKWPIVYLKISRPYNYSDNKSQSMDHWCCEFGH